MAKKSKVDLKSLVVEPSFKEKVDVMSKKKIALTKAKRKSIVFNTADYDWNSAVVVSHLKDEYTFNSKNKNLVDITKGNCHLPDWSFKYDNMPEDTIGVVFSGGVDSTCLMLRILEETKSHIVPIEVEFHDNWILQSINLSILNSIYPNRIYPVYHFGEHFAGNGMNVHNIGQQPMIHYILPFMSTDIYLGLKEIQIGYVIGDTAVSFQQELQSIYKGSAGVQFPQNHIVPLTYPNIKWNKDDEFQYIINIEKKYNKKFVLISCETPESSFYSDDKNLYILMEGCHGCHDERNKYDPNNQAYIVVAPFKDAKDYSDVLIPVKKEDTSDKEEPSTILEDEDVYEDTAIPIGTVH